MRNLFSLAALGAVIALFLTVGLAANAQDGGTPAAGTPEELQCATPLAEVSGSATPVTTIVAPTTAASPGGAQPGEEIGIFPCGTPLGSPIVGGDGTPTQ